MTLKYEGHRANSGGLQGHSIGKHYPRVVIGVGTAGEYQVLNCKTGKTGPRHSSYGAADVSIYNIRRND